MEEKEINAFDEYAEKDTSNTSLEGINGLGDSNYENEDFLSFVPDNLGSFSGNDVIKELESNNNKEKDLVVSNPAPIFEPLTDNETVEPVQEDEMIDLPIYSPVNDEPKVEEQSSESTEPDEVIPEVEEPEPVELGALSENIDLPETSDKEVEDLTKNIDSNLSINIDSLFSKINANVKEASDIFLKNAEIKKRIDDRFNELKNLQSSIEKNKKSDYDEINEYKNSVIQELTDKKNEVEDKINELKDAQARFESDRKSFEIYKQEEMTRIQDEERQNRAAYEERKEELEQLETKFRKQKDLIDEEKRQLSLDKIQYEADKNELANNLLKFNELVDTFTTGMDTFNEDTQS